MGTRSAARPAGMCVGLIAVWWVLLNAGMFALILNVQRVITASSSASCTCQGILASSGHRTYCCDHLFKLQKACDRDRVHMTSSKAHIVPIYIIIVCLYMRICFVSFFLRQQYIYIYIIISNPRSSKYMILTFVFCRKKHTFIDVLIQSDKICLWSLFCKAVF